MTFYFVIASDEESKTLYHAPALGGFIVISAGWENTRIIQIAVQVYSVYSTSKYGDTYIRTKHDANWLGWRKLTMES